MNMLFTTEFTQSVLWILLLPLPLFVGSLCFYPNPLIGGLATRHEGKFYKKLRYTRRTAVIMAYAMPLVMIIAFLIDHLWFRLYGHWWLVRPLSVLLVIATLLLSFLGGEAAFKVQTISFILFGLPAAFICTLLTQDYFYPQTGVKLFWGSCALSLFAIVYCVASTVKRRLRAAAKEP